MQLHLCASYALSGWNRLFLFSWLSSVLFLFFVNITGTNSFHTKWKQYYKHVPGRLGELFIAHVLSEAPVIPSSEKQAIPDKASQYLLTVSWMWNPEQEALKQSSTSFQNNTVRRWLSCVKQSLNHPCYGSPVFSLICFPHKVSRLLFDTSLFGKKTAEM